MKATTRGHGLLRLCVAAMTLCFGAVACARPKAGPESLAIGVSYELGTLDPQAEDTLSSAAILGNVYEPLVASDPELRSQPCLASSWESPDSRTWIFHLRAAVRFHSGRPLTAGDAVYSLRRLMGSEPFQNRHHLYDVAEVSSPDAATVVVRARGPKRSLLNSLRSALIVREGATEASLQAAPDGTGPYQVDRWDRRKSLRLARNERYWGPPPTLARVEYHLGQGPEEAAAGLIAGRYGLVQANSRKGGALLAGRERLTILRRDSLFIEYLAFDLCRDANPNCAAKGNPFRDPRLRQAIDMAVDRHRLADQLHEDAFPATEIVPRFVFGFDPDIKEARFDPEQARALMRQAGFGGGFAAGMLTRRVLEEEALAVKAQLALVGIALEVKSLADAEFFAAHGRREVPFFLDRNACLTGDAGEMLNALARSGRADADLRASLARSEEIDDVEARRGEIQALMRRIRQDLPLIPLYNSRDVYGLDRSFVWKPRADGLIRAAEIAPAGGEKAGAQE